MQSHNIFGVQCYVILPLSLRETLVSRLHSLILNVVIPLSLRQACTYSIEFTLSSRYRCVAYDVRVRYK